MREQVSNPSYFSRTDTKAIKGVAVVLMLFHHLAAFPARLPVFFTGFESVCASFVESGHLQSMAMAAKICVSLFFFLGGYGFYIRRKTKHINIADEIIRLYRAYWKVFLVFVPIAILFFANGADELSSYCTRYRFESITKLVSTVLSDFIGWTSNCNSEWWFFKSFICAMILGSLFCELTDRNQSFWKDIFIVFVLDILISSVFPAIAKTEAFSSLEKNVYYKSFFTINKYAPAYFAGIVFAKYDGVNWIMEKIQALPRPGIASALGLGILYLTRMYVFQGTADLIIAAFMVPVMAVFLKNFSAVNKIFAFLGKHSTNIWLIHSFYCYYFLEVTHVVFATRNVWVGLLTLLLLSLVSSIALDVFYSLLGRIFQKQRPV